MPGLMYVINSRVKFLVWFAALSALTIVFQKELYNFESLYKSIQRACTVFGTAIM
jgi:hypothetical protein